jgi:hypothetical protein
LGLPIRPIGRLMEHRIVALYIDADACPVKAVVGFFPLFT